MMVATFAVDIPSAVSAVAPGVMAPVLRAMRP